MKVSILDNGLVILDMDMDARLIRMALNMKDIGSSIKDVDKANACSLMARAMKETGKMISCMVMVLISIKIRASITKRRNFWTNLLIY